MPRLMQPNRLQPGWTWDAGDYVTALAWSPDGGLLAVAAADGSVTLVAAQTGALVQRLAGHGFGTLCLGWSPDGKRLATGGQDGKARIWDAATGEAVAELEARGGWVEHLAWSGEVLLTAAGKHLRVWNPDGTLLHAPELHPSTISGLQCQAAGPGVATSCYGGVRLWLEGVAGQERLFDWKGSLIALRWSPNGRFIACGCQDASVHIWFIDSGKDLEMSGYPGKVKALAWDRKSRYLATGAGADLVVWDFFGTGPRGSKPLILAAHQGLITDLAFQHDGRIIATGSEDGAVLFWSVERQRPLGVGLEQASVSKLAWHPDDRVLAAGYDSGLVATWSPPR